MALKSYAAFNNKADAKRMERQIKRDKVENVKVTRRKGSLPWVVKVGGKGASRWR